MESMMDLFDSLSDEQCIFFSLGTKGFSNYETYVFIDYLYAGMQPPQGAETRVASFAQEAFDKYIKRNVKLASFIKDNCCLEISYAYVYPNFYS